MHARVEARHRRGEYAGDHQPGEPGRHLVQNEVRENLVDLRKRFKVGRLLLVVDEQRRADPEKEERHRDAQQCVGPDRLGGFLFSWRGEVTLHDRLVSAVA